MFGRNIECNLSEDCRSGSASWWTCLSLFCPSREQESAPVHRVPPKFSSCVLCYNPPTTHLIEPNTNLFSPQEVGDTQNFHPMLCYQSFLLPFPPSHLPPTPFIDLSFLLVDFLHLLWSSGHSFSPSLVTFFFFQHSGGGEQRPLPVIKIL